MTLGLMDSVEKIGTVIPKLKYQLIFLKERDSLMAMVNNGSAKTTNELMAPSICTVSMSDHRSTFETIETSKQSIVNNKDHSGFTDKYIIPPVPSSLVKDITDGLLHKFGPHYTNRQILIDTIAHDLIDQFNLFYPSKHQFDVIGWAIVNFLKLPPTKENIIIWKDALQTKLKRVRSASRDHVIVQHNHARYSRVGSGRPIKKRVGELAMRDRHKQIQLVLCDETAVLEMKRKANILKDASQFDVKEHINLWRETLHFRRKFIRENPTSEIISTFPGYSCAILIFEEMKLLHAIDVCVVIRKKLPVLLEKLSTIPMFVTDSPPIRLLKILCREFDETVQHLISDVEPNTPYPMMVIANDLIKIYVDFLPITTTTSPDDAVALLLSMYTIFELNFPKNGRTIRLLYSILHSDKQYLTNTIRLFIREKEIIVIDETNPNQSLTSASEEHSLPISIEQPQSLTEQEKRIDALINDVSLDDNCSASNPSQTVINGQMKSSLSTDRFEHDDDNSDSDAPREQQKKNGDNQELVHRRPLENKTNLNNKRSHHSLTEQVNDPDQQNEEIYATTKTKLNNNEPKRKRRRR